MRLLFVTDNGFCKKNGTYFYSAPNVAHINSLSKFFSDFVVVARDDNYANGYQQVAGNIEVNLVPAKKIHQVNKVLKQKITSCDAVICYGTNGYFASIVGRKSGKVVISYNGGDPYDFCISRGTLKGKILAPIAKYMCKRSFQNSDFGHYCDDFLFERYPARGEMFACSGVDIECDEQVLKKRINKINAFDSNSIVKVGLIGHTKNSLTGIDIAIKAVSQFDNYILEIAGRGPTDKYMKMADFLGCSDRVTFLGALAPGDELMAWLDSLDIYIQPSKQEGLPRSVVEAMSRGCPVLGSKLAGIPELVDDRYMFKKGNVYDISNKIKNLLQSDLKVVSKTNFEHAKDFQYEVLNKKRLDFYKIVNEKIK